MSRTFWIAAIVVLLFFPASYSFYKYLFALIVGLSVLVGLLRGQRFALRTDIAAGIGVAVLLGSFLVLYDQLRLPWATLKHAALWIFTPIIFLLFTLLLSRRKDFIGLLDRAIYIASLLVSANALAFVFCSIRGLPYFLGFLDLNYGFALGDRGFVAYTTDNLPILAFTIPYMIVNLFLARNRTRFHLAVLVLSLVAACLSLRVALLLNVVLAAGLTALLSPLQMPSRRARLRRYAILGAMTGSIALLVFPVSRALGSNPVIYGMYSLKLEEKVSGDDPRYLQLKVWLASFLESPILGHGLSSTEQIVYDAGGISIHQPGKVRNPYGYELTYPKLLSEIGLIPFALYALLIACLLFSLMKMGFRGTAYRERNALSYLFGMLGFLLASGTNGYLATFGMMWTIYFPVAYQNHLSIPRAEEAS